MTPKKKKKKKKTNKQTNKKPQRLSSNSFGGRSHYTQPVVKTPPLTLSSSSVPDSNHINIHSYYSHANPFFNTSLLTQRERD